MDVGITRAHSFYATIMQESWHMQNISKGGGIYTRRIDYYSIAPFPAFSHLAKICIITISTQPPFFTVHAKLPFMNLVVNEYGAFTA